MYPEPSAPAKVLGLVASFPVGGLVGGLTYWALGAFRRVGAFPAFLARWWAWYVGLLAGLGTAVAIAGPYLLAGPTRGGFISDPITVGEAVGLTGVMSFLYAALAPVLGRRGRDDG